MKNVHIGDFTLNNVFRFRKISLDNLCPYFACEKSPMIYGKQINEILLQLSLSNRYGLLYQAVLDSKVRV